MSKSHTKLSINVHITLIYFYILTDLVHFEVDPKEVAYVVCTNGGSSYTGNNHMFKDCIHIIGHSIQRRNVFLPEPFSEGNVFLPIGKEIFYVASEKKVIIFILGKPYIIDEDELKVISTPGRTLDDVSVVVKTDKGIVVVAGKHLFYYFIN